VNIKRVTGHFLQLFMANYSNPGRGVALALASAVRRKLYTFLAAFFLIGAAGINYGVETWSAFPALQFSGISEPVGLAFLGLAMLVFGHHAKRRPAETSHFQATRKSATNPSRRP